MKPKSNIEDLQSPHTYHNINMQIIDDAEWLVLDTDPESPDFIEDEEISCLQ